MNPMSVKLAGCGRYMAERVVYNDEVEKRCNIAPGWIDTYVKIQERRWAGKHETLPFMGAQAAKEAVADAGMTFADIDLIINASGSPAQAVPDGAHLLQLELGLGRSGIPCMSVHTTCLSFISAMNVAGMFISTGQYKNILISSTEKPSVALNFKQPESAALFGDGAAAFVLTPTPAGEASTFERFIQESYGIGVELTVVHGLGLDKHPNDPDTTPEDNLFYMDGLGVAGMLADYWFKFFARLRENLPGDGKVDYVVSHQANAHALRAIKKFKFTDEQIAATFPKYGNNVAASIPVAFYEMIKNGKIQRGHRVLLLGAGAGLTLGGASVIY